MPKLNAIVTACFFLMVEKSPGQDSAPGICLPEIRKNVITLTAGTWVPEDFYFSLLGSYERMIIQLPRSFIHSFWVRAGAGPWAGWGPTGVNYVATISALTGRRASHFEIGSGAVFTYWSDKKEFDPMINERYIAGFIGFRYQKPGGYFVLRTGLGWPDGIYLSIGYCF